jgi:hypothetical protein
MIDKSEIASRMKAEDEEEQKQQIMNSVVQELKDHGDIDE